MPKKLETDTAEPEQNELYTAFAKTVFSRYYALAWLSFVTKTVRNLLEAFKNKWTRILSLAETNNRGVVRTTSNIEDATFCENS